MSEDGFKRAISLTRVVTLPKTKIATFWTTKFRYYIISRIDNYHSILRIGTIYCAKPTIVTPHTVLNTFEGFSSQDIEFAEKISGQEIEQIRVLGYQFKNKLEKKKKIATPYRVLIQNIKKKKEKSLDEVAILSAPDDVWSLSITKLTMDAVFNSFSENLRDFEERGYFLSDGERSRKEIEILFVEAKEERSKKTLDELGKILQKNDLFEEYEDRFFKLVNLIQKE